MPYLGKSPARGLVGTADIDDDAITLAKMASGTDGNLITYDASGDPAAVAVGTSGNFLKSQGAGSVPVFAEVASDWVLLETETASGAAASDFTSFDHSTYSTYQFVVEFTPDTDASHIDMLLAVSGTTYLQGSNYEYVDMNAQRAAGSLAINGNTGVAFFRFGTNTGNGNASDEGMGAIFECFYFGDANRHAQVRASYTRMDNSSTSNVCWGSTAGSLIGSTSAITAVRFMANTGNHTGKFKMYGRK